jgi:hypothetical protein
MKHGVHKQRERRRKDRPQERIRSHGARRVLHKRVDEVVQRRLEDGEEAEAHEHEARAGRDPEDRGRRRPAEHEEPGGEEYRADHHGREARFGNGLVVVRFEAPDVEPVVPGRGVLEGVRRGGGWCLQDVGSSS